MLKRYLPLLIFIFMLLIATVPVVRAQTITDIYVDPYRTSGNEDGTQQNPYNKEGEGTAYLQAQPYGGNLYIKNQDGTWRGPIPVDPAKPGFSGAPISKSLLYLLGLALAVILIVIGWQLRKKSIVAAD